MAREQIQKTVLLYLYWLGFLGAVLVVLLADILPFRPAFVSPENLFLCLIEAELFFVLVIWPPFVTTLLRPEEPGVSRMRCSLGLLLQACLLLLLALPLALVCGGISHADAGLFLRGHLLVAVLAVFVAALFPLAHRLRRRIQVWYYLGFFLLSAALPFLYFVIRERRQTGPEFLAFFSPFWAALRPDASLVLSAIFAAAAAVLIAVIARTGRERLNTSPAAG
jgi:hypothetical protein